MEHLIQLYNQLNKFGTDHGMELSIIEPGHIAYKMKILEKHLATPLAAHGGIISALMDGVLGVAALSATAPEGCLVSTVEFKINFLQPAYLHDELLGTGKIIQRGKRLIITEGIITCPARNSCIAKAIGTFNAYPAEKAGVDISPGI
jgi:uncharacterized protein (TIGR00369 family)